MLMGLALVIINDELQYARKTSLSSAQYCIKYTSDIIIKSSTDLVNEKSEHQYNLNKANSNIEDLVYRYNILAKKLKLDPISEYGFKVYKQ